MPEDQAAEERTDLPLFWGECPFQTQDLAAPVQASSRGAVRVGNESALPPRLIVFPLGLFAGFRRVVARPDYRAVTGAGYQEVASSAVCGAGGQ
jgi:hypothetical protein